MVQSAYDDMGVRLYVADARCLPLHDASVDVVVTSPPYFGLRAYKDLPPSVWGGVEGCEHAWSTSVSTGEVGKGNWAQGTNGRGEVQPGGVDAKREPIRTAVESSTCTRCGAWRGHLGNEPTVDAYLAHMVEVFREVRRVLKPTGNAIVNIGDSYSPNWSSVRESGGGGFKDNHRERLRHVEGSQAGSLLRVPARFAEAMVADGWLLRAENVWAKPSPMPESTDGWRWERCRVRVGRETTVRKSATNKGSFNEIGGNEWERDAYQPTYEDCPGCGKCAPNDGLVLRKGSWRTTRAHEAVYHFALRMGHYGDRLQAAEKASDVSLRRISQPNFANQAGGDKDYANGVNPSRSARKALENFAASGATTRNPRSVWQIGSEPSSYAHYAAYPRDLVERALRGLVPERVCAVCGLPWARMVDTKYVKSPVHGDGSQMGRGGSPHGTTGMPRVARDDQALGWRPTCDCDAGYEPGLVLDPFAGTGTTLVVARALGFRAVGIEYSQTYADMAAHRLAHPEIVSKRPVAKQDGPTLFDLLGDTDLKAVR